MKFNTKNILGIFFISTIILVLFSTFSTAGYLKHTVYSPLGNSVIESGGPEQGYYASELTITQTVTPTDIQDGYSEFKMSSEEEAEPFCKVGGLYTIKVENDASPAPVGKQTFDLEMYYCKTTNDILKRINIPATWTDSNNLIIYCNDGKNINFNQENFDFLTTRINTYKNCVVKNLELEDKNTIIFGFEVGNKIIDNSDIYFFNPENMRGALTLDLENPELIDSENLTTLERVGEVMVPYVEKFIQEEYMDSETGLTTTINVSDGFRKRTDDEALIWAQENISSEIVELEYRSGVGEQIVNTGQTSPFGRNVAGPESKSPYYYKIEVIWSEFNYHFYDKYENDYWFDYNNYDKFYTLRDVDEELDTSIMSVFTMPTDFGISRVALFKKIDDKYIYGYESAAMQKYEIAPYNTSINPIYTIDLASGFEQFSEDVCNNVLAAYEFSDTGSIKPNIDILCDDKKIQIFSENLNSDDDYARSFHLFKNIITSLK